MPDLVEKLRIHKEPGEIEALQAAVDLGDAAFVHVAERVEPGWTEKQVAWEIESTSASTEATGCPSTPSWRAAPGARCRTPTRATESWRQVRAW